MFIYVTNYTMYELFKLYYTDCRKLVTQLDEVIKYLC